MKEETKKVLLYKPSEMLAVDIKPLKFLDAELLCLIRQPAVRAKSKCWWFQLADAVRSHQVTVPVTLPLSRAALVSPCWWISLPSAAPLLQERSAWGAWVWRLLGISSTSDVSKEENITNFCSAWCFQEWSVYLPCFLEDATVQSVTDQCPKYLLGWDLPVVCKLPKFVRCIKLKIHKAREIHSRFFCEVQSYCESFEWNLWKSLIVMDWISCRVFSSSAFELF